ncbi:AI-2E family transporter [Terrihabitans soli]|uniref:AI-2E family transporter n=1 Tax=Terrihabitans soli TaxID=708113 RepID=A0A6S6QV62_9HYPH|nr:AI-2E family transporter [Terrihabitans soli]BCJ90870.1 AI-2E family transporter [Terrihabitans soli]
MTTQSAISVQRQALIWVAVFALLIAILWLLHGILLPFVVGFAVAYLLDPLADRLARLGIGRTLASILILLLFVLVVVTAVAALAPLLVSQFEAFMANLPGYVDRIQQLITGPGLGWLRRLIGDRLPSVQGSVGTLVSQGAAWIGNFLTGLWAGGATLLSVVSLLVVTPVVAFYMLVDWDRMITTIDGWLPRTNRDTIRKLAREINATIAGFVRGQATVCLLLGLFYAAALSLVGLNFGLLIGLGAGFIGFIPYVGSFTGLLVAGGVALVQFWPDYPWIFAVLGIFVFGQFIEGNILSPNLVGRSVGLHPVWLMFALFAFGSLFGFVGLLLAVPLAAATGVLVRFALGRYLESPLYTGGGKKTRKA